MIPPIPSARLAPGTLVRSETFPNARGVFVGVFPGSGSLWVSWRRCDAIATHARPADTIAEWSQKTERMAERLALFQARADAKQAGRN